MKLSKILLGFLSLTLVSQQALALEPNAQIIRFADTVTSKAVVKVVKLDDSRIFSSCFESADPSQDPQYCTELARFSAKKFQVNEKHLKSGKFWSKENVMKIGGTGVGFVAGIFVGALAAIVVDGEPPRNSPGSIVAFVVVDAAMTGIGYLLGSGLDRLTGKSFTALETTALKQTIANPEILDEANRNSLIVNLTAQDFRNLLQVAHAALEKK